MQSLYLKVLEFLLEHLDYRLRQQDDNDFVDDSSNCSTMKIDFPIVRY